MFLRKGMRAAEQRSLRCLASFSIAFVSATLEKYQLLLFPRDSQPETLYQTLDCQKFLTTTVKSLAAGQLWRGLAVSPLVSEGNPTMAIHGDYFSQSVRQLSIPLHNHLSPYSRGCLIVWYTRVWFTRLFASESVKKRQHAEEQGEGE